MDTADSKDTERCGDAARVVEAEAEVPRAMAEAFRQGHLGVMDYYRMKNVQADTTMRDAIARGDDSTSPGPKTQG